MTKTEQKIIKLDEKYRNSFVYNEDFEGKRFERYVAKTEEYVFNNYIKIAFLSLLKIPIQDGDKKVNVKNLKDFFILFLQWFYLDKKLPVLEEKPYFLPFHEYSIPNLDVHLNFELLQKFLLNPFCSKNGAISLYKIVENELKEVCKEFIRERTVELDDINIDNYFLTLPNSFRDSVYIFDNVIKYVKIDIGNFIASKIGDGYLDLLNSSIVKNLDKQIECLKDKVEALEQEIAIKEDKIRILGLEVDNSKKDEKVKQLIDQNISLQRKIEKSDRIYNDLLEKYNRLKEQNIQVENEEEVFVEQREIDLKKRYCFVAYGDITFLNDILSVFPNSFFLTKNSDINNISADLVICLTEHIDHSTYYDVKKRCSNRNIPFIHCKHSNVELIKNSIAEYYRNQIY